VSDIDLEKLTPAPWQESAGIVSTETEPFPRLADCTWGDVDDDQTEANARFIALARNAFDVMMRRGWGVRQAQSGKRKGMWFAFEGDGVALHKDAWDFGRVQGLRDAVFFHADPLTALIEADRWYRENVEAKAAPEDKP
jgi:hypothetical protein